MFNKKALLKTGLFVSFLVYFWISFTSAATFKLSLSSTGMLNSSNLSPVHFGDNGNNFGWFFYFSNGEDYSSGNVGTEIKWRNSEENQEVTYTCNQTMKWFYYNSERWERLWPLDEDTSESWGMTGSSVPVGDRVKIEWWLYTRCVKAWYQDMLDACEAESKAEWVENPEDALRDCIERNQWDYLDDNSYYWSIEHTYKGYRYWLIAWVKYDTVDRWLSVKEKSNKAILSPTFQRVENRYPVWLIYDYNWWVGLVWCELTDIVVGTGSESLKNFVNMLSGGAWAAEFFTYTGEDERYVEVNNGLNFNCRNIWSAWNSLIWMIVDGIVGMSSESEAGIIWNQENSKMQYFSSSNINNATLINYVKQRAGVLCRWKWNKSKSTDRVICKSGEDVPDASIYAWKTLVVKNGSVTVKPNDNNEYIYDIFVDEGWQLIIDDTDDELFVFKRDWFKSNSSIEDFTNEVTNALFNGGTWYCEYIDGGVSKPVQGRDSCSCICERNDGEVIACNYGNFDSATMELLACNRAYNWEDVAVWKLLQWNFIVNWNVTAAWTDPTISNKYFIHWKFTTKTSADDLMDVFVRECENGVDSTADHYYCPASSYQYASLVVIDQNYDSPLFW